MDVENCTPEQWLQNESIYKQQIQDDSVWNRIPSLNVNELHNLKDGRLVRFCGMVQDMHGTEYYPDQYEVINENTQESYLRRGKFHDVIDCESNETINFESPRTVRNAMQSYVVISIPALNPWVKSLYEEKDKLKTSPAPSTSSTNKRPIDEEEEMETQERPENTENNKRQRTEGITTTPAQNSLVSREFLLNYPIPDASSKTCHLKAYDEQLFNLNAAGEFVGFLSVSPILSANSDEGAVGDIEFQAHNPPPSLVPRIHCVAFRELLHNNPLIPSGKATEDSVNFEYIRKELLILFTQLLLGDELAAEYLIYHLISEVYLRKEYMAIGKFSLNISNVPIFENLDFVTEFYKFIEILVEKSHFVAMTLENMNELTFVPKKDYKLNRLTSSILQLSKNTHIVLDETKLSPGKLNIEGVRAIANAIKNQKNIYDFTYYQLDFECDIPFLVLSEGKSMLPSDSHVILKPDELHLATFPEILEAARHFLKPELLNEIRVYLTCVRRLQYELSSNVQELVQNEFVTMRQKGSVGADDLHSLLVLARLVCISQGKTHLDEECWRKACSLEEARKERIKQTSK